MSLPPRSHRLRASLRFTLSLAAFAAPAALLGSSPPGQTAPAQSAQAVPPAAIRWDFYSLRPVFNPSGRFYTYAPSVIVDGATEHIWDCQNARDGVIRDHIRYIRRVRGRVVESRLVLAPGPEGSWDSFHACDPSVIRARVRFNGTRYKYLMFYLGFPRDGQPGQSRHNQIGVAFAQRIGGPWVKYPRPLIAFAGEGPGSREWGVGQPSAISLDKRGRVMLFYTQGNRSGTRGLRRVLDMSEMSRPLIGPALLISTSGLSGAGGGGDWLNNFDVAYDPARDRFFMVREQHPYASTRPTYIGSSLQIASIEGVSIRRGGGSWRVEGSITPEMTGFARNHNGGLARSEIGALPKPDRLTVYFSRSCAASPEFACDTPEWSYDLWSISGAR